MAVWRKVIPEDRDRLQSKVLVWIVMSLLAPPSVAILMLATHPHNSGLLALRAFGVSLTFAVLVWMLRAATPTAAICGAMICLIVTTGTGHTNRSPIYSGLAPLMMLFVLTFLATRAGRPRKVRLGLAEEKRGRNAAQVIANLGASGLVVLSCYLNAFDSMVRGSGLFGFSEIVMPILLLAALCEATADTVSSEIGQAFGGTPVMLTSFRRVSAGTDGAVTVFGTIAGIVGAAVVAGVGMWAMRMSLAAAGIGLVGGIAGLFFDSLLGATVESKGWLGNDLVNFSSTVFAVLVSLGWAVLLLF